jgi:hypothetical protein
MQLLQRPFSRLRPVRKLTGLVASRTDAISVLIGYRIGCSSEITVCKHKQREKLDNTGEESDCRNTTCPAMFISGESYNPTLDRDHRISYRI